MNNNRNEHTEKYFSKNLSLRFALIYLVFGILWITFTDIIIPYIPADIYFFVKFEIVKGSILVFFTTLLIYFVSNMFIKSILHSQNELRKQREELQIIFDSVPALIWYKDKENNILRVNKVAADITGLAVDDIIGKSAEDIYPEEAEKYYQDDLKVINSGKPKQGIIETITTKEGKKIWIKTDKVPYYDGMGKIIGVIVFSFEITDQIHAEKQLMQNLKQQEALLNTIPAYVYFKDMDLKYIAINKAYTDALNLSPEEILGKSDYDFQSSELAKLFQQQDNEIISSGKPIYNIIGSGRLKNGKNVWTTTSKSPYFDSSGEICGIVGITMDITEQKEAEEELKKLLEENKKLLDEVVEYDKLKTAFFSNMSHEFKTPLNVILSTLQLISTFQLDCTSHICSNKIKRYMSIMKQNCFRLLRLINNLMDTTRIDAGTAKINLHNYNIVNLVEETVMSVSAYIENHGIAIQFDTDVEEKIIACDADKIERIILNLLSNAVKFTKSGGSIWVNLEDHSDTVVISVKDTGIGIPPDKFDLIFERFSQVNFSLTRNHEGSGIGLYLVKSLVEMHGGHIKVNSKLGEGSQFIIELPANEIDDKQISDNNSFIHSNRTELADIEFSDINNK